MEWNGRNVDEEDEEDEDNAMKMKNTMNAFREFGCGLCEKWKMTGVSYLYAMSQTDGKT